MAGKTSVPIRESVGGALRFVRENWRFVLMAAGIGAVCTVLVTALGLAVPQLSLLGSVAGGAVQAFVYASFVTAVLHGAGSVRARWVADGGRVWAAMLVVAFFLFIVFFALTIPVMMALAVGPMAPYLPQLQTAGGDQAAVMSVMTRFAEENPGALLGVCIFLSAIWMMLTSRLYLAAPASVDQQRILTFETWKWTKGAMLRIIGARLMLLAPANIFAGALGHLAGLAFGINSLNMGATAAAATANPVGFLLYVLIASFLTLGLFSALEAGLSSYLYRSLKPATAAPAA